MKMKDIKTLITSGTVILAVGLYLLFGPSTEESPATQNTPISQESPVTEGAIALQTQYAITPELAMDKTGNELVDVKFLNANDGDTFTIELDGKKERIRLLMLDTPEMNYNKGEPMPYAEEAKEFTTKTLQNATNVQVLFDVGPEADHYDRLLAYVFVDGVSLHELLLSEGYAAMRYINKPNNTLEQELRAVQEQAEDEKVRIWAHDGYFQKSGFDADAVN